ncbi:MAG: endonuclease/exonuclease/phosphatase family protein [Thermosynechococcaceae cyanobacterium MS004]|nr:endonuclease/exonuclease/phosphatase family protein [Thermosynechococcaceae cyanobacterium MS004]
MDELYRRVFWRVRQGTIASIWFYGLICLAWLVFRSIFFDRLWWLAILNTTAFYGFLPLLVLLPLAAWLRRWRLVSLLSVLLAVFLSWYGALFLPASPSNASGPSVTVMSFSLAGNNPNYDAIAQRIKASAPDILGLQEVTPAALQVLMRELSSIYAYVAAHPAPGQPTVALFSRIPIQSAAALPNPPFERVLEAKLQVDQRPLSVFVAHLTPHDPPDFSLAELPQRTQQAYQQRQAEAVGLKQEIRKAASTSVILCDCRMTDTSTAYAILNEALSDSFQEAGWGFGHTRFALDLPFPAQRTDYVWHTPNLITTQASVEPEAGSDHLPLKAQLRWVR